MVNVTCKYCKYIFVLLLLVFAQAGFAQQKWESKFIKLKKDGSLQYLKDEQGNTIPDFSKVGYHQNAKEIPTVKVVFTINPTGVNDQQNIQNAIDELSKKAADANGIRGVILLTKGEYKIPGTINISTSGIVLRGEGDDTKLIATGEGKRATIRVSGTGNLKEITNSRVKITDNYVPVGTKSFQVADASGFKVGDKIIVFRPGNDKWIHDLKMDQIAEKEGLIQWKAESYDFNFERKITAIKGKILFIDNPIVMAMEAQYGGGAVYKYTFDGRIAEVGIENMWLQSEFESDIDEDHGWDAISYSKVENSWVKNVTSRYFGYSCVNLSNTAKQITVIGCKSLAPKSQIIGGRRYSFNNDGQLNLFMNCFASEGRHDYVTGAKVCGPNVFYNCVAVNAKADIGPHHRWAMGTLYDNVVTDGEINIQDRGDWGTGHGWAGVNQILWNCTAAKAAVQNPYVSGKNYAIGLKAQKYEGRLKGRPDGIWEGQNQSGLNPSSLYVKQVEENKNR